MHRVALALGTNLGDRHANLRAAVERLAQAGTVIAASGIYETAPWGVTDQPYFYNMAVIIQTGLEPQALLAELKQIEKDLGRTAAIRYGPRVIDIDILLYDTLRLDAPGLTIPHSKLQERAFVLLPLAEIAAEEHVPGLNSTVAQLAAAVSPEGVTRVGAL